MAWNSRFFLVCLLTTLTLTPTVLAVAQAPPDSQSTVKAARRAQYQFERQRARYLPWTRAAQGGESEIIGRFRFWYEEDGARRPVWEHEHVVDRRNRLVAFLDSVSVIVPGDAWVMGQRIRYLVEASKYDSAFALLSPCRGTEWWCHALIGFVLHDRGDYDAADEKFSQALREMPDSTRCQWTDLSQVLDGDARRTYRKLPCAERHAFESLVWWHADPLLLVPGNERRTEHYARRTYDHMLNGSTSTFGLRWGKDNSEIVMRFGWPVRWERETPDRLSLGGGPTVIGQQRQGAFRFLPSLADLQPGDTAEAARSWRLRPFRPRARYAAAYAKEFVPLNHQLAAFKRGDSVVVVAVYQPPTITDEAGREKPYFGQALLALSASQDIRPSVTRGRAGRPLAIKSPREKMLVALETLSRRDSVAGRERYWIDLSRRIGTGFTVSDLLLLDAQSPTLPRTLAEAIPRARMNATAETSETVGVFWEFYEVPPDAWPVQIQLTVERVDKPFIQRAGEFLGVVGERRDRIQMRWQDQNVPGPAFVGRAITVRLPETPGHYLLRLHATAGDGTAAESTRSLEVKQARR